MALSTTIEAPMGFGPQEGAYAMISEVRVDYVTGRIDVFWVAYRDAATRAAQKAARERLMALQPEIGARTRDRENADAAPEARIAAEQAFLTLASELEIRKREALVTFVPMTPPQHLILSPEIGLPLIKDGSVSKADLYPILKQHVKLLADASDC